MAVQKFSAPLPNFIPHIDHDSPGDITLSVNTSNSNVSIYSGSWNKYYSIYLDWFACDPSHYPVRVKYAIKSSDGALFSEPSSSIVIGTTPKYEVYYRSTVDATPTGGAGDAGRWGYLTTTSEPRFPARIYDIDDDGVTSKDYVQFCVTGPVLNQEEHLIYDAAGDMTGLYTGSGTDYGPGGNWQIKAEDSHVIAISAPVPKGFA